MNSLGETAFIGADDDYDKLLAQREVKSKNNIPKAIGDSADFSKPFENVSFALISGS